jgi:signal transduction histidine kinase
MFSTFEDVLKYFVPASLNTDSAALGRCRIFVITHLVGPVLGYAIIVFLYHLDERHGTPFIVISVSITAFIFLPFALKYTGNLFAPALFSFVNLTFITLYGSFYYGGVSSPFIPWLLTALMLGFFYIGDRPVLVLVIAATHIFCFFMAYQLNGGFPQTIPYEKLGAVGLISVISAMIYVSIMALYYLDVVSSQSELLKEVERHRATAINLTRAREVAERSNRAKSAFLAKMSHELRTPLNAVIGYSELLLEDAMLETNQEQIADLKRINNAGNHLLALVTDVLDVSKIEAEGVEGEEQHLTVEAIDVANFLENLLTMTRGLAEQNQNKLELTLQPNLGLSYSDKTRLRQIIFNLVSNAAKFTKGGRITVFAERIRSDDQDSVRIGVKDTGIGICPEHQRNLFQDYQQASAATKNLYGGTGLGLAVSKSLCAALGGSISVESKIGAGSCFTVTIPADGPNEISPANTGNEPVALTGCESKGAYAA